MTESDTVFYVKNSNIINERGTERINGYVKGTFRNAFFIGVRTAHGH